MTADPAPARDEFGPCPTCGGRGWVAHDACNGRGCRECLSDGEVDCPYCDGPPTIEIPLDGEDDAWPS